MSHFANASRHESAGIDFIARAAKNCGRSINFSDFARNMHKDDNFLEVPVRGLGQNYLFSNTFFISVLDKL